MLDVWDILVILALFVTAVVVPFEVALLQTVPSFLTLMGRVIDAIFVCDMILTFNVALPVLPSVENNGETFEKRPAKIAAQYLAIPFSNKMTAGWFWPDLCATIPWDRLCGSDSLREVRLIRVLRLIRMLRLLRVIKLMKRWHMQTGMSFNKIRLVTCSFTTLMLAHWLACLWSLIGMRPETGRSWLSNHLTAGSSFGELSCFWVYTQALYLVTVVLTTVGFGDITPTNDLEVNLMIATLFFTGVSWAWVVANIVDVITNMDPFTSRYNQVVDDLNALMNSYGVRGALQVRVRRFLDESKDIQRRTHHKESIHWLSEPLQGELAVAFGVDKVCDQVWYLRGAHKSVVVELADEFVSSLFGPQETITNQSTLFVIIRGSCAKNGRIYSRNAVLGEDIILASAHLRDTSSHQTLNYVEMMGLHRNDLHATARKYPDFSQRLRRAQIKLALFREFIRTAKSIKKGQGSLFHIALTAPDHSSHTKSAAKWEQTMDRRMQQASDESVQQVLQEIRRQAKSEVDSSSVQEDAFFSLFRRIDTHLVEVKARVDELSGRRRSQQSPKR